MKYLLLLISLLSPVIAQAKMTIERWHTQNGTEVLFVNAPAVPMVDIYVAFGAGSAYDGKAYGLSALTTELLSQGSGDKSADEIADKLADSGAQFNSNSSRDMAVVSLRTLTESKALAQALTTFESILNRPSFTGKAIDRERQQLITAIKQGHQSPNTVANELFFEKLYGNHPYAHPVLGTEKTLADIDGKQIKQFYKQYFVGANATMSIVGAINKQQAKSIAEQLTHAMAKGKKPAPLVKAKSQQTYQTQRVDFPSNQTAVRIGQLGITHHDNNYFPLKVGNYILGGGTLVSRLSNEIREKRGLSYGISSMYLPLPAVGPFIINLATKNNQAKQAIDVTLDTVNAFVAAGPTDAELKAAKQYLTGSFPLSLATNRAIAAMLLKIGFYQLPLNFIDTYTDKVNAVSQEQIKQAFAKQLHPKQLLLVTVGQQAKPAHG